MSVGLSLANGMLKMRKRFAPIGEAEVQDVRAMAERMAPRKLPSGVDREVLQDGPVPGEWHRAAADAPHTMLYLHGGGYIFGSPRTHIGFTMTMAKAANAQVFSLDYRLAPEDPHPAAVIDAVKAWRWMLARGHAPEKMVISGDSAGGGLTLALLLKIKELDLPMPAAAILYSPWTDLKVSGESAARNEKQDAMFTVSGVKRAAGMVAEEHMHEHHLVSPLYGDLSGLPPLQIFVGDTEVLLDDSLRLAERAQAGGVSVELIRHSTAPHVWPVLLPQVPEGKKSIAESVAFWHRHAAI